jgi:hypothetical protein
MQPVIAYVHELARGWEFDSISSFRQRLVDYSSYPEQQNQEAQAE